MENKQLTLQLTKNLNDEINICFDVMKLIKSLETLDPWIEKDRVYYYDTVEKLYKISLLHSKNVKKYLTQLVSIADEK